jgi:hypothetical protein
LPLKFETYLSKNLPTTKKSLIILIMGLFLNFQKTGKLKRKKTLTENSKMEFGPELKFAQS